MSVFRNMLRPDQITTFEDVNAMALEKQMACSSLYTPCSKCNACHGVCAFVHDRGRGQKFYKTFAAAGKCNERHNPINNPINNRINNPINNPIHYSTCNAKRKAERLKRRAAVLLLDVTVYDRALTPRETAWLWMYRGP